MSRYNELLKEACRLLPTGRLKNEATGLEFLTGYDYQCLYDWDQYFEAIAWFYTGISEEYAINTIRIFLSIQRDDGFIPRCVRVSAPNELGATYSNEQTEHVKPFLAQITELVVSCSGRTEWITDEIFAGLEKYLEYWLVGQDQHDIGLSVWQSAPHSGMDNQVERAGWWHEAFGAGVDCNAFVVRDCNALVHVAELTGREEAARKWRAKAEARAQAMRERMWNEEAGFYYDIDARTNEQMPILHAGAFAAMWAGVATQEQAERMVKEHLMNPDEFWRAYPVATYAASEPFYTEEVKLGCYWRANTWAPTNYYVAHACLKYGFADEAKQLTAKTIELIEKAGLWEYFDAETGEGCGLNPFWGWTATALFMPLEDEVGFRPDIDSLTANDTERWIAVRERAKFCRRFPSVGALIRTVY